MVSTVGRLCWRTKRKIKKKSWIRIVRRREYEKCFAPTWHDIWTNGQFRKSKSPKHTMQTWTWFLFILVSWVLHLKSTFMHFTNYSKKEIIRNGLSKSVAGLGLWFHLSHFEFENVIWFCWLSINFKFYNLSFMSISKRSDEHSQI